VVQNAEMRRLVVAAVVAVCIGASVQIASDDDAPDARQVAEVLPFPRSTTPLPVPEVVIPQGPWQDEVPWDAPVEADKFTARCTAASSPPCVLAMRPHSE
jgi:hypothetical protein